MERQRNFLRLIGMVLSLTVTSVLLMQFAATAGKMCRLEELRVVRISGDPESEEFLRVEPRDLDITSGDCVVWVNWSKTSEIMVVFQEGKVCYDVTRPSAGFNMDAKNCYVTNYIPYGGTSSLTFKEHGTYNYEVVTEDGKALKCKLTVHAPKE